MEISQGDGEWPLSVFWRETSSKSGSGQVRCAVLCCDRKASTQVRCNKIYLCLDKMLKSVAFIVFNALFKAVKHCKRMSFN